MKTVNQTFPNINDVVRENLNALALKYGNIENLFELPLNQAVEALEKTFDNAKKEFLHNFDSAEELRDKLGILQTIKDGYKAFKEAYDRENNAIEACLESINALEL